MAEEPSSWAEALKRYETQKRVAVTVEPPVPKRSYRDARFNQKATEREYDVLTHTYRDPNQESFLRTAETRAKVEALSRARDVALQYESHWDITNGQSKVTGGDPEPVKKPRNTTSHRTTFNIFRCEPEGAPARTNERGARLTAAAADSDVARSLARDYNIISNKYTREDHEARAERENSQALAAAAEKFWKTNTFNPVVGAFYNNQEEQRFQQERQQTEQSHGQEKLKRLPLRVKLSEGMLYNITSFSVKDPTLLERHEIIQARANAKPQTKYAVEEKIKTRDEWLKAEADDRRMARIKPQRLINNVSHGYDIVTNHRFEKHYYEGLVPPTSVPPTPGGTADRLAAAEASSVSQSQPAGPLAPSAVSPQIWTRSETSSASLSPCFTPPSVCSPSLSREGERAFPGLPTESNSVFGSAPHSSKYSGFSSSMMHTTNSKESTEMPHTLGRSGSFSRSNSSIQELSLSSASSVDNSRQGTPHQSSHSSHNTQQSHAQTPSSPHIAFGRRSSPPSAHGTHAHTNISSTCNNNSNTDLLTNSPPFPEGSLLETPPASGGATPAYLQPIKVKTTVLATAPAASRPSRRPRRETG